MDPAEIEEELKAQIKAKTAEAVQARDAGDKATALACLREKKDLEAKLADHQALYPAKIKAPVPAN